MDSRVAEMEKISIPFQNGSGDLKNVNPCVLPFRVVLSLEFEMAGIGKSSLLNNNGYYVICASLETRLDFGNARRRSTCNVKAYDS